MGWTTGRASRDEVVKRKKGPYTTVSGKVVTATKYHRHEDQDWFLYEIRNAEGAVEEKTIRVIVWDGGSHKEMSECAEPYCDGCPVEWFDEVPVGSERWRELVRRLAA